MKRERYKRGEETETVTEGGEILRLAHLKLQNIAMAGASIVALSTLNAIHTYTASTYA